MNARASSPCSFSPLRLQPRVRALANPPKALHKALQFPHRARNLRKPPCKSGSAYLSPTSSHSSRGTPNKKRVCMAARGAGSQIHSDRLGMWARPRYHVLARATVARRSHSTTHSLLLTSTVGYRSLLSVLQRHCARHSQWCCGSPSPYQRPLSRPQNTRSVTLPDKDQKKREKQMHKPGLKMLSRLR